MTEVSPSLIVVHAQHPLEDGISPGPAFAARLDRAIDMYTEDSHIYVPGSRHRVGEQHDVLSLSDAGVRYIRERLDARPSTIHGQGWNEFRKGGVYTAADEAYVATTARRRLGLSGIVAVASTSQLPRLVRHYRANGEQPEFSSVEGDDETHGGLVERVLTAYTLFNGDWQSGLLPAYIRKTRIPLDGKGIRSTTE